MPLIGLQNVTAGYGGPPLLENVNLHIEPGERVGLLGRNGAGKTTLLRLISGDLPPEQGSVTLSPGATASLLTQQVPTGHDGTVFDEVVAGLGPRGQLLAAYHHASQEAGSDEGALRRLDALHHRLEAEGAWTVQHEVESVLGRMGLDPEARFATMSAGMKRRVLLARALVSHPDVLLLDEPTNHLDIPTIGWMEQMLLESSAAVVFVTHDRAFLRRISTRIVEIDRGHVQSWDCDYDAYLARREQLLEAQAVEQAQFDRRLAQEEAWIRRGVKARRTRDEGRVRRLEAMREQRRARRDPLGQADLSIASAQQTGRRVSELRHVCFRFPDGPQIVDDFSTFIARGDRVGILGPNGAGKTTLLRLLLGDLTPDGGQVIMGTNREVAYFDQLHGQLDLDRTVIDNVSGGQETLLVDGKPRHVLGYLERFLFTPAQARGRTGDLSGGERNRVLLARLFLRPSNLLVLDEPTNDLDAETLELLEDVLIDYAGTVLLVSHDREFLNNVVSSIIAVEGGGVVKEYVGGYDDYLRQKAQSTSPPAAAPKKKPATAPAAPPPRKGLTYGQKLELEALPAQIEQLEAEHAQVHDAMCDPGFYAKPAAEVSAATARLADLKARLQQAYARWEELELLAEG